jgi:high-affinity iron transporter
MKGRMQQALAYEMSLAVRAGRVEDAKAFRAELGLPRGVSSSEGALLLQAVKEGNRDQTSQLLVREAITWQTTRVRVLFDDAARDAGEVGMPMPGRLMERLGEALVLADLPEGLKLEAGLTNVVEIPRGEVEGLVSKIRGSAWGDVAGPVGELRRLVEARLPSLLTAEAKKQREKTLLKLLVLIPQEYAAGVRDGEVTVPFEYREAVIFTQEAHQIVGELAPLWLADGSAATAENVRKLDALLTEAAGAIKAKSDKGVVSGKLAEASGILKEKFGVSIQRSGTTAEIVEEVMLEVRTLLSASLKAALEGKWEEAKRLRLEAYTTFDPELEARLLPRDPQLALNIERLLLDGMDGKPGVGVLLDRKASAEELIPAYERVNEALKVAAALLKTDISPTAAVTAAASIVLREGLEGLLVIIAILAGLRGVENAGRRKLFWGGILLSVFVTAGVWILSQTVLTSLRHHAETIAAITGILAIAVLLLITNWLFHQVYWRQWVTTLKNQAQGEKPWQLVSAGFLVGYREGFETILFLQSLYLDAGGRNVSIGVAIGVVLLLALGVAALKLGMKLPYFHILLATAVMIGFVLITFVGGTVRAMQTVGWLPATQLMSGSWPFWMGNWFGLYNTRESVGLQVLTVVVVLGTWRVARFKAKRKHGARRVALAQVPAGAGGALGHECPPFACEDRVGCPFVPAKEEGKGGEIVEGVRGSALLRGAE